MKELKVMKIVKICLLLILVINEFGCSSTKSNLWEYAELGTYSTNNERGCYWSTSDQVVKAPSYEALTTKLNVALKDGSYVRIIMDHFGQQGWELVSFQAAIIPRMDGSIFSVEDRFIFKRPYAPKQKQ